MIRPGLLIASTSNADHLGMSVDCFCLSIVACSFFRFVLLKRCFPLVATEGTRLSAQSAHRRAKRRGALEAQRRVVRMGCRLRWKQEGETNLKLSRLEGTEAESSRLLNQVFQNS